MNSIEWQLEKLVLLPPEEIPEEVKRLKSRFKNSTFNAEAKEQLEKFFSLLKILEGVPILEFSKSDWLMIILKPLIEYENIQDSSHLSHLLADQVKQFIGEKENLDPFTRTLRKIGVLAVSKYLFYIFLQTNWTGPKFSSNLKLLNQPMSNRLKDSNIEPEIRVQFNLLGDPNREAVYDDSHLIKTFIDDLNIDGEVIYEMTRGIGFLWASICLLQLLLYKSHSINHQEERNLQTLFLWYSRVSFIWQRIIRKSYENTSPTLLNICVKSFEESLKKIGLLPDSFSFKKKAPNDLTSSITGLSDSESQMGYLLPSLTGKLDSFDFQKFYSTPKLEAMDSYDRSSILLEYAIRLSFFGYTDSSYAVSDLASRAINFKFELSGAFGIRRKYQTQEFAQLVVKTFGGNVDYEKPETDQNKTIKDYGKQYSHKYLALNEINPDTDILETPQLSEELEDGWETTTSLSSFQQCLLLSRCSYLQSTTPASNEIALEELAAIVQRCLILPHSPATVDPLYPTSTPYLSSHWLVFSSGLWFRCKAENHRTKTVERAALQLQSLVDQYHDEEPSGLHRLKYIHILDYPNQWETKKELGTRMLNIGSLLSAFNMFKDMMMWEEAVNCLVAANRKSQAKTLLEERLKLEESPPLWCIKGKLDNDYECFIKAWNLSNHKYAGAQRLLGMHYFQENNLEKAVDSLEMALKINPLHSNSWFTLGCSLMRLECWEKALTAFSKVVTIDPDQGEAWANMAGIHIQTKHLKEAVNCIEQALRYNRDDWRIWDSYLKINVQLKDIPKVIEALHKMILDFKMKNKIPIWIFEFLHFQAINNQLEQDKSKFEKILKFFEFIANEIQNIPDIYFQYANLLKMQGDIYKSLKISFQYLRQTQNQLFNLNPQNIIDDKKQLKKALNQILNLISDPEHLSGDNMKKILHDLKLSLRVIESKMDQYSEAYDEESTKLINDIMRHIHE